MYIYLDNFFQFSTINFNNKMNYNNPTNYSSTTDPFPENDINSTPPFIFPFPNSPHNMEYEYNYDDLQFLDLFSLHQSQSQSQSSTIILTNMPENSNNQGQEIHQQIPNSTVATTTTTVKKKKKDRHSKIETARGPRDRRMRLSLEVARKFFDLQDLLGYDKASRTVEWLLRSSNSAIRDLSVDSNRRSCSTLVTVTGGAAATNSNTTASSTMGEEEVVSNSSKKPKPKAKKKIRSTVPRESRRKARERARERTSQKRRLSTETTVPLTIAQDLSSVLGNSHQNQQIGEFELCAWDAYNSSN
ncbi:hypothetical protein ABFS82_04G150300 [Erythranthe guttata]|nr:PREDICTED: transcription factor CYCLOIDEA-like [Erythranthe guttata]|eukprot:XP_012853878.1 PREDICTED: transcription factor CYCLOIDEA-like [Erythranthe guttata]